MIKIKILLLKLQLLFKDPKRFIREISFKKSLGKLEAVVKRKALTQHELKVQMNAYYYQKAKAKTLNQFQLMHLVNKKFAKEIEASGAKAAIMKNNKLSLR